MRRRSRWHSKRLRTTPSAFQEIAPGSDGAPSLPSRRRPSTTMVTYGPWVWDGVDPSNANQRTEAAARAFPVFPVPRVPMTALQNTAGYLDSLHAHLDLTQMRIPRTATSHSHKPQTTNHKPVRLYCTQLKCCLARYQEETVGPHSPLTSPHHPNPPTLHHRPFSRFGRALPGARLREPPDTSSDHSIHNPSSLCLRVPTGTSSTISEQI